MTSSAFQGSSLAGVLDSSACATRAGCKIMVQTQSPPSRIPAASNFLGIVVISVLKVRKKARCPDPSGERDSIVQLTLLVNHVPCMTPFRHRGYPIAAMAAAKSIFTRETFRFFRELAAHNRKVWMDANRERYQSA